MSAPSVNRTTALDAILQEWRQQPRLRYGIYLMLGIFWLYGILVLRDAVTREQEAWQAAESRNTRARATATSADWLTRAQEAAVAVSEHEKLLWREGSIGFSQAVFQERINQGFSANGITVRALRLSTAADAPVNAELTDIVPLRARAQVEFRASNFYAWLASLSARK